MGTFYLHIRDKEELLVALAKDTLLVIREQVHAAIEQHPSAPLVPLIIRTLLRRAYEQRELFHRLARTFGSDSHEDKGFFDKVKEVFGGE